MRKRYTRKDNYLYYKNRNPGRNFDDPKYKEWRQQVYKRDNRCCQMPDCTYKGKRIEAHHIVRWADAPLLRYELSNGITLCYRCHKKIKNFEHVWAPLFINILMQKRADETKDNKGHARAKGVGIPRKRIFRRNRRKKT